MTLRNRSYLAENKKPVILKVVIDKKLKGFEGQEYYIVKNGRKTYAKVSGPNKDGDWLADMKGTGRYLKSRKAAFEYIRQFAESHLNMMSFTNSVKIQNVPK